MNNKENKSVSKTKNQVSLSILNHPSANFNFKPEFAPMPNSIYYYIASNFFQILGIDIITRDNFHHIIDSFRAFRSLMRNLNLVELVDSINYALDYLAEYLPVEPENRYLYRDKDYRMPRYDLYFSTRQDNNVPNQVKKETTSFISYYLENSLRENLTLSKSTLTDRTLTPEQSEDMDSPDIIYETNYNVYNIQENTSQVQGEYTTLEAEPQIAQVENIPDQSEPIKDKQPEDMDDKNKPANTNTDKFKHVSNDVQNMIQKIKKQGQK